MRHIDIGDSARPTRVDAGAPPMLQWLKIADLVVDDEYQRELKRGNWTSIRRIADRFKWSRFSPVFVAPIAGGKYAIIDGQHRTHAAALCGFNEVPCQVVQMSREEQAASFAAVNGLVTKVTLWNILRAAVVAGEEWATDATKVCADAGCKLMTRNGSTDEKKPGEIYVIALVRDAIRSGNGGALYLVLSGIRRSEFGKQAEAYNNEIIRPFLMAVSDRPWLVKARVDLAPFVDRFDIYAASDRSIEFVKVKRRQGHTGISRYDICAADIGEGLDKTFPQRMAAAA